MTHAAAPRHVPRKRFGQHFLTDSYIVDRIIALIQPQAGDHILEIGPGGGVLTRPLVASGAQVMAVELDRDLGPALLNAFADDDNFELVSEDILKFDLQRLSARAARWKIVGNLPYNISTPLIMHLLAHAALCSEMTFMLQREVGERLTATIGAANYGRLTVMAQRRAVISNRLEVPPGSFAPPPKVDSSVVQLIPHATNCSPALEVRLAELVRVAFAQRRKTVSNALKHVVSRDIFAACAIDPQCRAQNLSGDDYERLARACLERGV